MKVSKKFLSMLLVVAMVLSFSVISASAEPAVIINGAGNSADDEQLATVVNDAQKDEDQSGETGSDKTADEVKDTEVKDTQVEDDKVENPKAVIYGSGKTYEYATLEEAIVAAREGATIQVADDITFSNTLYINKSVKIELAEATLTFENKGSEVENALVVGEDAAVTIHNGVVVFVKHSDDEGNNFGFVNGIVAEKGCSLVLDEVDVKGKIVGGDKLSGDVSVKGGEFDFDPSLFVDEDYVVTGDEGVYTVAEKIATYPADEESSPYIALPTQTIKLTTHTKVGDKEAKELIPASIEKDLIIDLAGFALTGDITVAQNAVLTIINSHPDATAKVEGNITLDNGMLVIEDKVTIDGDIVMDDNSCLVVSSSGVTVKGEVKLAKDADISTIIGNVIAGTFEKPTELLKQLIPETHMIEGNKVERDMSTSTNHVRDAFNNDYDAEDNYLQYFKGETELAPDQPIVFAHEAVFVLISSNDLTDIKIDGKTVAPKYYDLDSDTRVLKFKTTTGVLATDPNKTRIIVDAFEDLTAGAHDIVFTFDGGTPKEVPVPMFVWPSVVFDEYKYTQGSTDGYTVKVTDEPTQVWLNGEPLKTGTYKFDKVAKTLTITADTMNALPAGDVTLTLVYEDSYHDDSPAEFQAVITVVAKVVATITPVETNKDNSWVNSAAALSYNVSSKILAVYVDGVLVDPANYSVSDKNVLSLKAEYLKTLGYGKHTLAVSTEAGTAVTEDGTAYVEFTTGPSLVAKNGSNHTKGGQKDLVFVASDPMNSVWVGGTQLKSDYYTISDDGKTITLKASFLNTLKADNTYTISAFKMNADGKTAQYGAKTTFRILSAASAGATPKTGDTGVGLWVALLVMSGAAMAVIIPKRKEN